MYLYVSYFPSWDDVIVDSDQLKKLENYEKKYDPFNEWVCYLPASFFANNAFILKKSLLKIFKNFSLNTKVEREEEILKK